jgi:hypothetical protein
VGNIKLYLRWMMSEPIGDTMVMISTGKDTQFDQKHDPHTSHHTATVYPAPKAKVVAQTKRVQGPSLGCCRRWCGLQARTEKA